MTSTNGNLGMARRIRRARALASLTQTQLAQSVGVVPSAVAQWEGRPATKPTLKNLLKIATTTACAFEWLATGRGDARPETIELPAVTPDAFAHDDLEERLLALFRSVSTRRRAALLKEVERLVGERLA